jgi:hypothetical protein
VRLDHLLSKEHTARSGAPFRKHFRKTSSGYREVPTSSTGLCGFTIHLDPGAPASRDGSSELDRPGRHRHHRDFVQVRFSLLCFEEVAATRPGPRARSGLRVQWCPLLDRQNGCRFRRALLRARHTAAGETSPDTLGRRLGWNFENCIASTSVLEMRCGPRSSNEFSARSNARGLCDFKL